MKILVLGWEYPPVHSGGLGVASKNLSLALAKEGLKITFALPSFILNKIKEHTRDVPFDFVSYTEGHLELKTIPTTISSPYETEETYEIIINRVEKEKDHSTKSLYGKNLFEEIERYSLELEHYVHDKDFHLIHAHDWITFAAAAKAKSRLDVPLVTHVHSTEFDRTGGNPNQMVYDLERNGLEKAEKIIAVSNYTKYVLQKEYGIKEHKIAVVHNGIETRFNPKPKQINDERKKVLFLGRLTLQKGPDWLIEIAKKVLSYRQDVDFLIAGKGEMMTRLINEVAKNGMQGNVHFLGFVGEEEREKAFAESDVYLMPSVSEPFGLSAVEAAQRNLPVVMSKQSGAKEVIYHSLSADFWDVDKMANNILSILEYPALKTLLASKATQDLAELTWEQQCKKVHQIYKELVAQAA